MHKNISTTKPNLKELVLSFLKQKDYASKTNQNFALPSSKKHSAILFIICTLSRYLKKIISNLIRLTIISVESVGLRMKETSLARQLLAADDANALTV